MPGDEPNRTTAGYTVDEILRDEPVTVVGSTDQVTGRAEITGTTLTSGAFEARVETLVTDNASRDTRARSPEILDAEAHPIATLALAEEVDLGVLPDDGTTTNLAMQVDLTIKGNTVSKDVDVTVLWSGEKLIASGGIAVTWSEVGVQSPDLGFVEVDENGTVDFRVAMENSGHGAG